MWPWGFWPWRRGIVKNGEMGAEVILAGCLFMYSNQANPSTLLISWVWNFLISRKKYQDKFYMYSCHVYLQGRGGNGYGEQEVGKTPSQWGYPEVILRVHGPGGQASDKGPNWSLCPMLLHHRVLLEVVDCQGKHYEVNIAHNGEGISCVIPINANETLVVNFPCLVLNICPN